MGKETIEEHAGKTILQTPKTVIIGGEEYKVAPPTMATLIMVSEIISTLPQVKLDAKDIVNESLFVARYCRPLGDVLAVLILGAKGLTSEETESRSFFFVRKTRTVLVDRKAKLAQRIMEECSPHELYSLVVDILSEMQISDFFGLTASLIEVNLLRKTREAEMTQSGR